MTPIISFMEREQFGVSYPYLINLIIILLCPCQEYYCLSYKNKMKTKKHLWLSFCYFDWAEVKFTAKGQTGHGSLLHENTAAEKVHKIINKMLALRTSEKERQKAGKLELGDVTTINMTMLEVRR